MNIDRFDKVKGFMPFHEGEALFNWASFFSKYGSILEIGTDNFIKVKDSVDFIKY